MASSTIDQLLQATKLPRASDEAPRAAETSTPFKPALEQALAQQPAVAATPTPPPQDDEPSARSVDADGQPYDASENSKESPPEVSAAAPVEDDDVPDEEATDDAVEISEQASTAAATATAAQTVLNHAAIVGPKPTATFGNFQPAESAGDAAKNSADTAPGANAPAHENTATKHAATTEADAPAEPGRLATTKKITADEKTAAPHSASGTPDAAEVSVIADEAATSGSPTGDAKGEPTGDRLAADSATESEGAIRPTKPHADTDPQAAVVATEALVAEAGSTSGESANPAPNNDLLAADATVKPVAADGAAAAPARQVALLDRLTAPRGLRPNSAANEGEPTQGVDRARFVSRVEGAMRAAHQRDGRVQVRLSPPELGALRIELQMQAGSLTAHIEAETASARKLLLDNLPALRDRLAQQDIRVEKFEVDVRRDGAGQSSGGGPQDRSADQPARQSHDGRSRPSPTRTPTTPVRPAATSAAAITDAGLDVRV